jgi:hemerythrin-like domain-containing protein
MRTAEVLEALRREHAELRPHVEGLRVAGDAVALPSARDAFELVNDAWRFVSEHLLVHAEAEERTLYPAFAKATGSPEAGRLMTIDHEAIHQLAAELGVLRRALADHDTIGRDLADDLRRVLYGLYALVRCHFDKEEAVMLPVLEARLRPDDANELLHRLHRVKGDPVSH